jgi:hypothetical protein
MSELNDELNTEVNTDPNHIYEYKIPTKIKIGNVNYAFNNKLETMVQNMTYDWNNFLQVNKTIDYNILFEEVVNLLHIKENEYILPILLTIVKNVYDSPPNIQISSMIKQYGMMEPLSMAIAHLFSILRVEYESIVIAYINTRNSYINKHKLPDKLNDIDELLKNWQELNNLHKINTSSLILYYLNPDEGDNNLHIEIKKIQSTIILNREIKNFKYKGFCPKVPHERLIALLNFPVELFINTIKELNPSAKFPDFENIGKTIEQILTKEISKPNIDKDEYVKLSPPNELIDIELIKWYVSAIVNYRKHLLKYSQLYDNYFIEQVKLINEVIDILKAGIEDVKKISN